MLSCKTASKSKGFTLWEVLLVLVLLAALAFLAGPSFSTSGETIKSEVHKANLLLIDKAVRLYYLDIGSYPSEIRFLVQRPPGEGKWRGPYLEEIPEYPFDADLAYEITLKGQVLLK
ncbi:MAG: type II secretion system protein GspG [Desulfitobacteriia bacterium]|jgi:general secretion pathway protein G